MEAHVDVGGAVNHLLSSTSGGAGISPDEAVVCRSPSAAFGSASEVILQ